MFLEGQFSKLLHNKHKIAPDRMTVMVQIKNFASDSEFRLKSYEKFTSYHSIKGQKICLPQANLQGGYRPPPQLT